MNIEEKVRLLVNKYSLTKTKIKKSQLPEDKIPILESKAFRVLEN
jgi:hypothetical protein